MNRSILFLIAGTVLWVSCASAPVSAAPLPDVYPGTGRNASQGLALAAAKVDAVRQAVVALVGEPTEATSRSQLDATLYQPADVNQYVVNDTLTTVAKTNLGSSSNPNYELKITVQVKRAAIEQALKTQGIPLLTAGALQPAPSGQAITPQQKALVTDAVSSLTYMVVYSDTLAKEEPLLLKGAMTQVNTFLVARGFTVVDPAQVEKLRKDAALVYEESTGEAQSVTQWIAQNLGADVYVEVDGAVEGATENGKNYATATVTLKAFDTSTAQLLGTLGGSSPRAMNPDDLRAAKLNALAGTIWQFMTPVLSQAQDQFARDYLKGIRYEVVINKTPDSRMVTDLRTRLKKVKNVTDVATKRQSADQTKFDVYYFGRSDDLTDAILELAANTTGWDALELTLTRGKSLVFASNL